MKKLRVLLFTVSVSFLALISCNSQNKAGKNDLKIVTVEDSVSYSIGINIGRNMLRDFQNRGLDSVMNYDAIARGLLDMLNDGQKIIDPKMAYSVIQNYMEKQQQKTASSSKLKASKNLEEGNKFLAENKKKEGVITLKSGLQYKVLKKGTGASPAETDQVTVHYTGTLLNGKVFGSSVERGKPAQFKVNQVIKGWTEALQLMKTGAKWKLFIPANLAYGERSPGGIIGPNEVLIFEVELISIDK